MGGRDNTITTRQARWVEDQKGKNRSKLQGYISNEAKSLISKLVREREELFNQGAALEYVLFKWLKLQAGEDEAKRAHFDLEKLRQENGELRSKLQQVIDERTQLLKERDDLKAQLVGITDGAGVKQLIEKWRAKAKSASGPRWAQLKKFLEEYEKLKPL